MLPSCYMVELTLLHLILYFCEIKAAFFYLHLADNKINDWRKEVTYPKANGKTQIGNWYFKFYETRLQMFRGLSLILV